MCQYFGKYELRPFYSNTKIVDFEYFLKDDMIYVEFSSITRLKRLRFQPQDDEKN